MQAPDTSQESEYSTHAVNTAGHWDEICTNSLSNTYRIKVKTDKWGNIVMIPSTD